MRGATVWNCVVVGLALFLFQAEPFSLRRSTKTRRSLAERTSRFDGRQFLGRTTACSPRIGPWSPCLPAKRRAILDDAVSDDDETGIVEEFPHRLLDFDEFEEDDFDLLFEDEDGDELENPVVGDVVSLNASALISVISSNVSYFYLQNELGLSEEAMWRVTFEAGSALGMTASTLRRKVDVLKNNMNLSDEDIRLLLERHPAVLHLSADKNIAPTILFLVRALDLGKDELRSLVLSTPSLLSYSKENLKSKLQFFTSVMGYSIEECRNLLLSEPKLLRSGVSTGLLRHMRFLCNDLEVPIDMLRKVVQLHPPILLYSIEENLVPKLIFFLIMTLQMSTANVQKLLLTYPAFLQYNLDRHIQPIADFFLQDLEMSPNELSKILLKFPRLVTHSLPKIKHLVGYLRYELRLSAAQVKRVIYQAPQLVGLNTDDTLKEKVEYLQSTLGLTNAELRTVVAGMPTLLTLSTTKNLDPKITYLREAFGERKADLKNALLRLPTLLGYSLEKRIRPRMDAILGLDLDPDSITVGISMKSEKFNGWLSRRHVKASKRKRSLAIVPRGGLGVSSPSPSPSSENGRIRHWTRPRRRS